MSAFMMGDMSGYYEISGFNYSNSHHHHHQYYNDAVSLCVFVTVTQQKTAHSGAIFVRATYS